MERGIISLATSEQWTSLFVLCLHSHSWNALGIILYSYQIPHIAFIIHIHHTSNGKHMWVKWRRRAKSSGYFGLHYASWIGMEEKGAGCQKWSERSTPYGSWPIHYYIVYKQVYDIRYPQTPHKSQWPFRLDKSP